MEYHDQDPERRNLVLFSLAFLIYFVGDGEFKSGEINFQIINLHLNNTSGIALLAWLILFWFFYRFMLKHSSAFFKLMVDELGGFIHRGYIRKFVEKKLGIKLLPYVKFPEKLDEVEEGWVIGKIVYFRGRFFIHCLQMDKLKRDFPTGTIEVHLVEKQLNRGDVIREVARFDNARSYLTLMRLFADYCFTKPNFSTNLFPLLIFTVAVSVGLWDMCLS